MISDRRSIATLAPLALIATVIAALSLDSSVAAPAAQTPDIAALVSSVDQQRITDHVAAIDEPRNAIIHPAQLQATADYLEAQLSSFGYPVTLDPVAFNATTFPNVIGVQLGTVCPERVFIVGAHYDSFETTPGADDNASGTAAMLEIARVLAGTPLPATVWYTGITLEESGLLGSIHMAQQGAAAGTEVVGMLSLEMIGYTTAIEDQDAVIVIGNDASIRLVDSFRRASASFVPSLPQFSGTVAGNGETIPDIRRSDHAAFWDAGYQAMIVTDGGPARNLNYHLATDTIDTLDMPFLTNVTKAMLATTVEYLTFDGDGDSEPDACTGPLSATATPTPVATPTPTPTPEPVGGIAELPQTGRTELETPASASDSWVVPTGIAAATVGAIMLGATAWLAQRRRRGSR